jgi:hypothetical protein
VVSSIGSRHRRGDLVGVHVHLAGDVAGRAPDRLDERALERRKPSLSASRIAHEGDLGQVETLAQQVDADEDVVLPETQLAQQLDPAQGVDVGVQVAHPHALLEQVVGEVLGHLLGQRRDEHPLVPSARVRISCEQVVDLALGGLEDDLGVDQTGRADDLLDDAVALASS